MRTFDQTVAAIGSPLSRVALDDWSGRKLVVARWRHHDVHVKRTAEDAFRIAMSLGLEQTVRFRQTGFTATVASVPGDIRIFPPIRSFETIVEGDSDVLQIFIDARAFGPLDAAGPVAKPLLNIASEDLRACALALFVSARSHVGTRSHQAAAMLRDTLLHILAAHARDQDKPRRGGLPSAILSRIDEMIDADLAALRGPRLSVDDLADEARFSVGHFIRAFRQTMGTTPHQHVMARRRQRALGLLCRPQMSVAEVADTLGFSSPAHFVASFRRRFGTTPGDYQRAVLDPDMFRRGAFD